MLVRIIQGHPHSRKSGARLPCVAADTATPIAAEDAGLLKLHSKVEREDGQRCLSVIECGSDAVFSFFAVWLGTDSGTGAL